MTKQEKARKKELKKIFEKKTKRRKYVVPSLLYVVLYLICAVAVALSAVPPVRDFEVGSISPETVTATKDIEDKFTTEANRQMEMQKVLPIYKIDDAVSQEAVTRLQEAFNLLEQVRVSAKQTAMNKMASVSYGTPNFNPSSIDWETVLNSGELNQLQNTAPSCITKQNIYTVASMEQDKLTSLRDAALEHVRAKLAEGILADSLEGAAEEIRSMLIYSGNFSNAQADVAFNLAKEYLKANKVYDTEATEAAKEKAAEQVMPVEYKKGQNIVRAGEVVTESQYEVIKELGLVSDDTSIVPRVVVSLLMLALVFVVWFMYMVSSEQTMITSVKDAFCVVLLTALGVGAALLVKAIDQRIVVSYLLAMIGTSFLRKRTALIYAVFAAILLAFMAATVDDYIFSVEVFKNMTAGILGSLAAILSLRKRYHRGEYILAGLVAGLMQSAVYLSFGIMQGYAINRMLILVAYSLSSGLLCGFLTVGILPVWESLFSLATPSKLLELSNPANELLKRLMIEAPGTYHHCVMAANLAEAGAEAVNGDALLARVSAYYHDIGKLENPLMFKENQMHMGNPHDELKPEESARIIISHVQAGEAIAERYKLPKRVRSIIREHHGNSLANYFYYMAKQENPDVDQELFRYPGPTPGSKESGVVMLADVTEAAVRANASMKKGNLLEQIEKLIKGKYDDGQLDNCPLNRRDLRRIAEAFAYVIEGANHERIIYPEDEE